MSSPNATLSCSSFQKQLAFGAIAETLIAKWLMRKGYSVLPMYDIEYETGKGPRLFGSAANSQLVVPDFLGWKDGRQLWFEAKHKTTFTWYRKKSQWETGIDLHHWKSYLQVVERTRLPAVLLFFHRSTTPAIQDQKVAACPKSCPAGLFGGRIELLAERISHTDQRWGRYGMVYWADRDLRLFETLENMLSLEGV